MVASSPYSCVYDLVNRSVAVKGSYVTSMRYLKSMMP